MPRLPREILYLILQSIHENAPALKQCALVNRSWLHEAQPLLFNTHPVCIEFFQNSVSDKLIRQQSPHEIIRLMDESPHLRPLIQIVELHLANIDEDFGGSSPYCQRWSMTRLLLPLHNAGLRAIKTLVLYDRDSAYEKEIILDLPRSVIGPGPEMTFSSVTCLDIAASINTPSLMSLQCFLCSPFPQLRHLLLRTWPSIQDSSPDPDSMPPPNTLCLQRLDIGGNDGKGNYGVLMAWFSQTRTVDTLEYLTFLGGCETPGIAIADFMATLSKPWSLHIMKGDWRKSRISSSLVHLMKTYSNEQP
jgi:hypothetical protein